MLSFTNCSGFCCNNNLQDHQTQHSIRILSIQSGFSIGRECCRNKALSVVRFHITARCHTVCQSVSQSVSHDVTGLVDHARAELPEPQLILLPNAKHTTATRAPDTDSSQEQQQQQQNHFRNHEILSAESQQKKQSSYNGLVKGMPTSLTKAKKQGQPSGNCCLWLILVPAAPFSKGKFYGLQKKKAFLKVQSSNIVIILTCILLDRWMGLCGYSWGIVVAST